MKFARPRPASRRRRRSSCRNSASAPATPCWPPARRIARGYDDILVMFGDTPLIEAAPLLAARQKLARGCGGGGRSASAPPDPAGYGRLIEKDGKLVAIREEKDCLRGREEDRLLQWRADGDIRKARARAARRRSATTTPRANIISPTSSRSPAKRASMSSPPRRAPRACSASTTAPNWPKPRRSGSAAAAARPMLSGVTLIAPETVYLLA